MISAKLVKELRDLTGAGMMDCKKALEATEGDIQASVDWLREKGISNAQKKSGRIAAEGTTKVTVKGNRGIVIEVNSETDFVAKNVQFVELVDTLSNVLLEANPADLDAALAVDVNGQTVSDLVVAATATIGEKITLRRFAIVEKSDDEVFGEYMHMGGKISALAVLKNADEELAKDMAMQIASMSPQYVSQAEIPLEIIDHETNIQVEIVKNDESLSNKPEQVVEGIIKGRVSKSMQDISLVDQIFFKDGKAKVSQVLKSANANVESFIRFAVGEGIEKREEDFAAEVAKAAQV
ncbi:translation elongation factor Ts [Erysipelothrix rhusiopathiae]|nr:translation elongation factor Ts [Erysipelothrix rhusiopathiae]MDE8204421.1 translation elongation factor Ts [Erysipelothrix rhusiopathiae]MDE8300352.1 translation elongation factor Ts [Erysipelothrix rhusiopathiae]MDE8305441.1 translation elongation factor Ts [Erysipelothrix rhusiopathiae]